MKNPFKSKYYFRILDKIAELKDNKEDAEHWLKSHGREHKHWPYYDFKKTKCQETIEMLRGLL